LALHFQPFAPLSRYIRERQLFIEGASDMDLYPIVDLLGLGVAIVTKQARIIVVNHAARAIFDNSGVLSAPNGKLKAKSVAHSRALFDAIARVAQAGATAPVGFSI